MTYSLKKSVSFLIDIHSFSQCLHVSGYPKLKGYMIQNDKYFFRDIRSKIQIISIFIFPFICRCLMCLPELIHLFKLWYRHLELYLYETLCNGELI